jgi:ACS family glucarate transporter-like MFS transporter
VVSAWIGDVHRGLGSSFTLIGIGLGGALTPILITSIMRHWGWRMAFYICAALGIAVALVWYRCAADRPEDHRGVNAAELALIRGGQSDARKPRAASANSGAAPWGNLLSSVSVIALVVGYFCQGFPIYFYHTWFFIYLVRGRGFSLAEGGFWGATPYVAIAIMAPIGGLFSDFAAKKLGKKMGRKVAVWVGMFCSAGFLWAGGHASNKVTAILLLAAAAGFNMFASATFWAACIDLSERFSGSLGGLMNTFGNLGGWLSPIVTAYVASSLGWTAALTVASVVTFASGLSWLFIDTSKPVTEQLPLS